MSEGKVKIFMASDMLSQEEIDALLKGDVEDEGNEGNSDLTSEEKDALGEIGNISMGTAATTLFTLLGQKVIITTPKVSITSVEELSEEYPIPFVAVDVKYKYGIEGANVLILRTNDVKIISDLMMGGDGKKAEGEVNEMDLSAISEAMNQMVGSSSTSLSEMFSTTIDIDPPRAFNIDFKEGDYAFDAFGDEEPLVKISFKMVIGDLIDSEIMQLLPFSFAKSMVDKLFNPEEESDNSSDAVEQQPSNFNNEPTTPNPSEKGKLQSNNDYSNNRQKTSNKTDNFNDSQQNIEKQPVNVQKVDFQAFDNDENTMYNESIDMIKDIPIELTAELGRTIKPINEILEYGPGTVIELDKLVGEPLEIFANGKFIAKGEVVVIDDNFGIRITDIINPAKRINRL